MQKFWLQIISSLILFFAGISVSFSQNPADAVAEMDYYLPADVTYDESIPTPEDMLDMVPGEWHVRHDQLVQYMQSVAESSDRISIEEYARTYENRPLLLLTVTSESNHQNIDQIRRDHLRLTDAGQSSNLRVDDMPVVVYLGYSVHGNEPSGSNASLLAIYHLAAAQGSEIEEMLENTIILLDPSLNPDGLNRFAHWANSRKAKNVVADPNNMEQNEPSPSGRTNHYWFDLNRDWLLVQHPESRGRIANFNRWKPNILTDHHEMGTISTFFFQPGIPSRAHPLTPERNQNLTAAIAEYHAEALDNDQRLYYSEENYDDFYYGKGSTYPDINGGIGILFEQASSRSHAQESPHGVLKFPFTIKNQFTTTLSTLKAANELRTEILEYQRDFYREAAQEAEDSPIKAYVFGSEEDHGSSYELAKLIRQHDVEIYKLNGDLEYNGQTFSSDGSYIVPSNQKQYRLLRAMFERRTEFPDSLFYDVSAWTLPHAFNVPFAELDSYSEDRLGQQFNINNKPLGEVIGGESNYAYLFEWDEYYAPRALYRLQEEDVRTKVASRPFRISTAEGVKEFDYGSILIPMGPQETDAEVIHDLVKRAAEKDGLKIYAVSSGLTPEGMDLGSRNFEALEQPKIALLAGSSVSSYEAGETWHLLDQRFDIPVTLLTQSRLNSADLSRYNVIVMPRGWYGPISNSGEEKLKRWVRSGGTLIAYKRAIRWAESNGFADIEFVGSSEEDSSITKPYASLSRNRGAQQIGGSIFNANLDLTHPLGYGYNSDVIKVFRNNEIFLEMAENPYATPVRYTDDPLASGYISDENLEKLRETAAVIVTDLGDGKVITMTDNPNFRAYWYGTNKLFLNAVFFGHTISGASAN